jgi:hypothetical protein
MRPDPPANILGNIISVAGLLGASLYFTGWIYRWAYFSYYQLEVTTLDFPLESFLLVPLQVFFGNAYAIFHSLVAALFTFVLIVATLVVVTLSSQQLTAFLRYQSFRHPKLPRYIRNRGLRFPSLTFLRSLFDEAIIVFWVLLVLFWLARDQGWQDAQRDAINQTSTLPVVALISPDSQLILGINLDRSSTGEQEFLNPSLQGHSLIGDPGLIRQIQVGGLNDIPEGKVWRLLIERGNWIYLFRTLSKAEIEKKARPVILAIPEVALGKQLMILSPNVAEEKSP